MRSCGGVAIVARHVGKLPHLIKSCSERVRVSACPRVMANMYALAGPFGLAALAAPTFLLFYYSLMHSIDSSDCDL